MGFPKLWADVCGRPLIAHALASVAAARPTEVVVVVAEDRLVQARALVQAATVVAGGSRRRDSVAAGLAATTCEWLAVHDAARALAPPDLFHRGLRAARSTGAAIPAVPLKDTIKRVADSRVIGTPVRSEHVAVQTPQVFHRRVLSRALALSDDDVTDEAALAEQLGIHVAVFEGDERAFKVTTPLDLALVRGLLALEG
jgi:2-C-methyl-D-erythritol 4-phosphate cytidylyltransferase